MEEEHKPIQVAVPRATWEIARRLTATRRLTMGEFFAITVEEFLTLSETQRERRMAARERDRAEARNV